MRRMRRLGLGVGGRRMGCTQSQRRTPAFPEWRAAEDSDPASGGWRVDRSDRTVRGKISDDETGHGEERFDDPAIHVLAAMGGLSDAHRCDPADDCRCDPVGACRCDPPNAVGAIGLLLPVQSAHYLLAACYCNASVVASVTAQAPNAASPTPLGRGNATGAIIRMPPRTSGHAAAHG